MMYTPFWLISQDLRPSWLKYWEFPPDQPSNIVDSEEANPDATPSLTGDTYTGTQVLKNTLRTDRKCEDNDVI